MSSEAANASGGGAGEGIGAYGVANMRNSEKKLIKRLLEALRGAEVANAPAWIHEKRRDLIHARSDFASGVVEDFAVLPRAAKTHGGR